MPTFAAVDIGANSVRLKIARLLRRRLHRLHEDRQVTRLGASVFRTGLLSPDAMAQTVEALERFRKATLARGADQVRVVATSALRDARNAQAFLDWVRAATGWTVEVITGLEEGRLIHLGLLTLGRVRARRVLMVDLGGGSCELTLSEKGHIRHMFSLPLGAVRLTGEFLGHDPPKKKELERLREYVGEEVGRVVRRIAAGRPQRVVATSGTAAALAARARRLGRTASGTVSRAVTQKLARQLAKLPLEERAALAGIGPRRAEIIIAGAEVFAGLMERCNLRAFRYSPLGLRDGVLAQMAADCDRSTRLGRQVESERWDALLAVARRYDADLKYSLHVRRLAARLFAALRPVHDLPPDYQEWLLAAAMLQEVGSYLNRTGRHRHAYYLIANSEIFGYTPRQRRVIATIARYVGNSRPAAADKIMKKLAPEDRRFVPRAVVLLRLARALNQGRRATVTGLRARLEGGRVLLKLKTRRGAELELWALAKERNYFREVFGRDLAAGLA
ncbi:MAG TPA: Ppx/GppA phosphatase family protein [Terriglobales bacterium]|nr:Ppx/GppA phosphatase family protein [Terriglobales bacterium]